MKKKRAWFILIPAAVAALAVLVCLGYLGRYYHADAAAREALVSDGVVQVTTTDFGWLFDGPSEDSALIFYPGGKVEAAAYAPLCQLFARSGADVCLVEMPVRLALFGRDKASGIMDFLEYDRWYLAGHSLGGVAAASYAAEHGDELAGLVLLASQAFKEPPTSFRPLLPLSPVECGCKSRTFSDTKRTLAKFFSTFLHFFSIKPATCCASDTSK